MNVINNNLFKIVVKILMEKNIKRSTVAIQISQKNQQIQQISDLKGFSIQTQIALSFQVEISHLKELLDVLMVIVSFVIMDLSININMKKTIVK